MTQPLRAEDYRITPPGLRQDRLVPGVTEIDAGPDRHGVAELSCDPATELQTQSIPTMPVRSRLSLLGANLIKWLRGCAEAYAAAAAYENLSRLSDRELQRQSLTRDVLARDL